MLKRKLSKTDFEALDPGLKSFYKLEGEDYILQVEGMVPTERLTEFRDNNVELQRKLAVFKDVDPAKYTELLQIETDLRNGKLKDGKTVEQIVEERIATMRKDHEKKVAELTESNTGQAAELNRLKITDAALILAQKKGLKSTAADDLKTRAEKAFKLDEKGRPVVMEGDKPKFGKSGEPMGIEEWLDGLVPEASHLFEASSGTGAGNGNGGNGNGSANANRNPWKRETFNLTEQGQILKKDPALAKRLKAEAGQK